MQRGYTAIGYEINPYLYFLSWIKKYTQLNADERKRATFRLGNIWEANESDVCDVDVVTIYGRPGDGVMLKAGAKLAAVVRPDALVVSNTFAIPNWDGRLVRQSGGIKLYDLGVS